MRDGNLCLLGIPLVFHLLSLAYYRRSGTLALKEEAVGVDLPQCKKCTLGVLVPLSDYGPQGASLEFKAWACVNPECGFTIRIDKGILQSGLRVGESKRAHEEHH